MTHLEKGWRSLDPIKQRNAMVKAILTAKGQSLKSIAIKHRITHFHLTGALTGKFHWSRRIVEALELELGFDLTDHLTKPEAKRMKCVIQDDPPLPPK